LWKKTAKVYTYKSDMYPVLLDAACRAPHCKRLFCYSQKWYVPVLVCLRLYSLLSFSWWPEGYYQ